MASALGTYLLESCAVSIPLAHAVFRVDPGARRSEFWKEDGHDCGMKPVGDSTEISLMISQPGASIQPQSVDSGIGSQAEFGAIGKVMLAWS